MSTRQEPHILELTLRRSKFLVLLLCLLALVWVLICGILERLEPGLIYYSVFTLTTVGPQKIHPISGPARAWTGIRAIVRQFQVAC